MMISKIYEFLKRFIKDNLFFLIGISILLIINFVKVPYEVMMPGGTIDLNDRVIIDGEAPSLKGSFNMAYVTVVQGNIPYVLVGAVLPDWDVIKMDDEYNKENVEAENLSNRLQLLNSKNAAKMAAYEAADVDYVLGTQYNYVTFVGPQANTTLKVGDDIRKVDGKEIKDIDELLDIIASKKVGDKLTLEVLRNGNKKEATATLYDEKGKTKLGISVLTTSDIESDLKVEINSEESESGPSGGMMMALMIYNAITEQDLTHGKKIVGTGTIDKEGNVGVIGGIKYKVMGAEKNDADIFLVPEENYKEAIEVKKEKGYDIEIISVKTLNDAIDYLEGLK